MPNLGRGDSPGEGRDRPLELDGAIAFSSLEDIAREHCKAGSVPTVVPRSLAKKGERLVEIIGCERATAAQAVDRHDGVDDGLGQRDLVDRVAATGQLQDVRAVRCIRYFGAYVGRRGIPVVRAWGCLRSPEEAVTTGRVECVKGDAHRVAVRQVDDTGCRAGTWVSRCPVHVVDRVTGVDVDAYCGRNVVDRDLNRSVRALSGGRGAGVTYSQRHRAARVAVHGVEGRGLASGLEGAVVVQIPGEGDCGAFGGDVGPGPTKCDAGSFVHHVRTARVCCRRVVDRHHVDRGAAAQLRCGITGHAAVLDDVAEWSVKPAVVGVVAAKVVPFADADRPKARIAQHVDSVFLTRLVWLTRIPVRVGAALWYARVGPYAEDRAKSTIGQSFGACHPSPGGLGVRVASAEPPVALELVPDEVVLSSRSDRGQVALQSIEGLSRCARERVAPGDVAGDELVEVAVAGERKACADVERDNTRHGRRVLAVVVEHDLTERLLEVRGRRRAVNRQHAGRGVVAGGQSARQRAADCKAVVGGIESCAISDLRTVDGVVAGVSERQSRRDDDLSAVLHESRAGADGESRWHVVDGHRGRVRSARADVVTDLEPNGQRCGVVARIEYNVLAGRFVGGVVVQIPRVSDGVAVGVAAAAGQRGGAALVDGVGPAGLGRWRLVVKGNANVVQGRATGGVGAA